MIGREIYSTGPSELHAATVIADTLKGARFYCAMQAQTFSNGYLYAGKPSEEHPLDISVIRHEILVMVMQATSQVIALLRGDEVDVGTGPSENGLDDLPIG